MKQYPVKYKSIRDHRKARCVNPHCGKWMDLYQEKTCPTCGKRSVERVDKIFCDHCHTRLLTGDWVCPLCGSKQRTTVELRGVNPQNLKAFSRLLQEVQPNTSLAECRKQCRNITEETPYRLSFAGRPEQIQPFVQRWMSLGGVAKACLDRETSLRPFVLVHSYNRLHEFEHARLLFKAIQKSDRSSLSFEETVVILHSLHKEEKPLRLCFLSDFDQMDAWVAAWRNLGGTAVHSREHQTANRS